MTSEEQIDSHSRRPIVLSPWLVVVGALLLYGLTLNHWVALRSLPLVAQVTGWNWQPYSLTWRWQTMAPLFLVLTAPVRLLPVAWQPLALNVFTALCAALTLGLLAQSVHLLPHDRTKEQRLREQGPHALLSFRAAFLPPLFAVLILATQLAFWQNAVVATGEMLNLLVFAFVIYCLLKYRISENDRWLLLSAFVYGAGDANNWALLGFFPLYIIAVVWIKKFFGFFNVRFLACMLLCGLAGNALYLLIPVLGCLHDHEHATQRLFYLLGRELGAQSFGLKSIPRYVALLAAVPWLLPLFFAGIKWPAFAGELSAFGNKLTRFMLSLLHMACLALSLAVFFDFQYSPSVRMREQPATFLTFYYLAALSVGYFSGYILLVFRPGRLQAWERRHPLALAFNVLLVAAVWVFAFGAPALLVWQNYPHIRAANTQTLRQFADHAVDALPARKSIVLSDDAPRLYLLEADLQRRGSANNYMLIDTEAFPHREYIYYLTSRYPELKSLITTNLAGLPKVLSSDNLVRFVAAVTRKYPVYYLHPSFGYYFEALYLKPHAQVYELGLYASNMMQAPLVSEGDVRTNQAFWAKLENGFLKSLPDLASLDLDARAVSADYSVALDFWGAELQKAGRLKEAHDQFAEAVRLNTNNFIAAMNLQYNQRLQKADSRPIDASEKLLQAASSYGGLASLLRANGPPDEPGLILLFGQFLAQGGNMHQAARLFQRRLQLLPADADAQFAMAKTYVDIRPPQPAKALELVRALRKSSKISPWQLDRCEAMAYVAAADYPSAEKLLRNAIQADPSDENRVATLAYFYRMRGFQLLMEHKDAEATRAFTNALTNVGLQLRLLNSPGHDAIPAFDVREALLEMAELQIKLRAFPAAVTTLSQILQLQPGDYTALLNRAVSEIQIKKYDDAKDDFKHLGKLLPTQLYIAEYGLADVAAAEKNKAEEISHLRRCARLAPEESTEFHAATNRLAALERK